MTKVATGLSGGVSEIDAEEVPKKPQPKFLMTNALDHFNKLDYTIAGLDIETLDLSQNCVVHEIGIVFTNILPKSGMQWSTLDLPTLNYYNGRDGIIFSADTIRVSIIEQQLNGRTVTKDTLDFHAREMKKRGIDAKEYFFDHEKQAVSVIVARGLLEHVVKLHSPKEVWVNHTSFDIPRITGAIFNSEANALPWHYWAEMDLHTAKAQYRRRLNADTSKIKPDPLKFPDSKKSEMHDAIADCLYNLSALSICMFDVLS